MLALSAATSCWSSHVRERIDHPHGPNRCSDSTEAVRQKRRRAASAEDAGVAEAVAAGLGEDREAVGAGADGDGGAEVTVAGVDEVDLAVVAARQPQLLAVGGDAAHVGAAAGLPVGDALPGPAVDHRHGALTPVGDVEEPAV